MSNNEEKYEYVSALMDDEFSEAEIELLLQDEGAQQKWLEYHLIRECMQFSKSVSTPEGEVEINKAIAEPVVVHEKAKLQIIHTHTAANSRVFRTFAVAASFLAVAVAAWQLAPQTTGQPIAPVAVEKQAPIDRNIVPVAKTKHTEQVVDKDVVVPNAALVSNMDTQQKVEPAILTGKPTEETKIKQASEPEKIQ